MSKKYTVREEDKRFMRLAEEAITGMMMPPREPDPDGCEHSKEQHYVITRDNMVLVAFQCIRAGFHDGVQETAAGN